jgi:hypothetical protein
MTVSNQKRQQKRQVHPSIEKKKKTGVRFNGPPGNRRKPKAHQQRSSSVFAESSNRGLLSKESKQSRPNQTPGEGHSRGKNALRSAWQGPESKLVAHQETHESKKGDE